MDCLFCKIVNGEIPSKTVYEDEIVKVIMDVNPKANGHMLIIPKKHFTDFEEIDDNTLCHIHKIAKEMKLVIYDALKPDGLVLAVNYGLPQAIKHYHLHLLPDYKEKQKLRDVDEIYKQIKDSIK